jgi:hypothetical protein
MEKEKIMKAFNRLTIKTILFAVLIVSVSCESDVEKPVLPDASTFTAPALQNAATADPKEFTADNLADEFEEFTWSTADYGIGLSVKYELEIDDDQDFSSSQVLGTVEGSGAEATRSLVVTNEEMNDAMLALGLPGFEESTVYLRVKSTINDTQASQLDIAPLYSGSIERKATVYQSSECGNHCSVGIIGSASPGGWDTDTDLRLLDPTRADKYTWTTIVYLTAGNEVKFRAMDDWAVNWGGSTFPNGTGTQNGPNIPVSTSGYYKVTFNDNTGAYSFTLLTTPVYTSVGIIGSATADGWNSDQDLTKDPNNAHVWMGTFTLTAGEAKFRAENDWAVNWGSNTAPSGVGIGNGANIPIAVGGTYFVRFNDATGEYFIGPVANGTAFTTVGLIGPAQANGWDSDTDLIKNPSNPYLYSKVLTLNEADAKFRANDAWDVNWGASTFPAGVGVQNGANIPAKSGKYFISFNSLTGEYSFLK